MLVQGKEIYNLIPQRPPMVMVDSLIDCSEQKAVTGLKILTENIFVINNRFTEPGLIENIAQSAALMTGWQARTNADGEQKISLGVIGAVKDFQLHFFPDVNSQIITEIEVLYRIANATIVTGKVKINADVAAECELKIFTAEQL
jgi:3-hydroxymyristoyl/3-hydroxydecanoyl-(acyl carrier protein) dehydratase